MEQFRLPNLAVEKARLQIILSLKAVSTDVTCEYSAYEDYFLFDGSTGSMRTLILPGNKIITSIVTNAIGKSNMFGGVTVSAIKGPEKSIIGWQFQARMKR